MRGVLIEDAPRAVPEPPPPEPEPEPEPEFIEEELEEIIEEPSPPTWYDIWVAEEESADSIILTANARAGDVRRRAHDEGLLNGYAEGYADGLKQGREQGYREGHEHGYADGHGEAIADAAEVLHSATRVAAEARIERAELLEAVDNSLVELVMAIARRVILAELTVDPSLVQQSVRAAIRAIGDSPIATIHFNPDDAEILQETWDELRQRFGDGGLQLVPDPRIQRGGCIVDADNRTVDAEIASKLDEIQRQFVRLTEPRA
jgi:flagellar assembly protein FliH